MADTGMSGADVKHGTLSTYSRHGCRCDLCKEAKRAEYLGRREAVLARAAARREDPAFVEENRQRSARWYAKNRDRQIAASIAWAGANRDRSREIKREYQARNPEVYLATVNRRRARLKNATVVPFGIDELAQRLSMYAGCWICGGPKDEVDHVKPLAAGGIHALCNLRPICLPCNRRKSSRWPFAA